MKVGQIMILVDQKFLKIIILQLRKTNPGYVTSMEKSFIVNIHLTSGSGADSVRGL